MLHRVTERRDSDEGNCTLQDRRHPARCGSRREHLRRCEILAGWRSNELSASPGRSPCPVRPSGSRTRDLLLIVCPVRGISCLAFGRAGKNNSSSHWCFGMGAFRVSTPWGVCELQRTFWSCTDSFCCTCNLHWMGSLAIERCPFSIARRSNEHLTSPAALTLKAALCRRRSSPPQRVPSPRRRAEICDRQES
jgi:hypothetical protein